MDRIIEVKVNGNYLTKDSRIAGVQHEANAKTLRIEFDAGWDGFAKKVTFWDANGLNPVERTLTADLLEDITASTRIYLCPIPGEAMAESGEFTFVIDGYVDGKRQRSISDTMEVRYAPFIEEAGKPADPTPTQVEQLQVQIDTLLEDMAAEAVKAVNAKTAAETAQTAAETAQGKAEDAQTAAETAQSKAETAGENAKVWAEGGWITQEDGVSYQTAGAKYYRDVAKVYAQGGTYDPTPTNGNPVDLVYISGAENMADKSRAYAEGGTYHEYQRPSHMMELVEITVPYANSAKGYAADAKASKADAETAKKAAEASQSAAEAAQSAAVAARDAVSGAKTEAVNAATDAKQRATDAEASAVIASVQKDAAVEAKTAAEAAQAAAEKARDDAQAIAGGDFATKTQAQGYANTAESNAKAYTDEQIAAIPAPDVSGQISTHNSDNGAHADIREAMTAHTSNTTKHITSAERTNWNGKLNKSGGTMTGQLTVEPPSGSPKIVLSGNEDSDGNRTKTEFYKNASSTADNGTVIKDSASDGTYTSLIIRRNKNSVSQRISLNDNGTTYYLYGEHYKPNLATLGAAAATHAGQHASGGIDPITPASIGAYTKAESLSDTTKTAFGLDSSAVPDDVLSILGKYSQHWWKRRSTQILPTPSTSTTKVYLSNSYGSGARVIYYSDSAIVNEDGSISLVNEQSTTVRSSESTGFPNCIVLKGKYIRNAYSPSSSDIYFIPEDATFKQETSPNNAVTVSGYKVSAETVVGEWEFLQSPDRNAYPDSGESGGYEYQYLSIPFDNAVTAPKVATGSYTGTGGVGPSNPCVLNLGFNAKLVVVYPNSWPKRGSYGWGDNGFIWLNPCMKDHIDYNNSSSDYYKLLFSMTDGVFSYNLGGEESNYSNTLGGMAASYQCNESGKTYYYIAIG